MNKEYKPHATYYESFVKDSTVKRGGNTPRFFFLPSLTNKSPSRQAVLYNFSIAKSIIVQEGLLSILEGSAVLRNRRRIGY